MKTSTAAGLVGAAMLSTLIFPFLGRAFQERAVAAGETGPPGDGSLAAPSGAAA
jgi:hypothetical protein